MSAYVIATEALRVHAQQYSGRKLLAIVAVLLNSSSSIATYTSTVL
jgi:hypothetical protein